VEKKGGGGMRTGGKGGDFKGPNNKYDKAL